MVLTETPVCDFGQNAHDFSLIGTDGKFWTLADCRGENGTLIMFICNHCPYVKAIQKRLSRDCRELLECGVSSVAIMSNDPAD
ncbi:MAG: redoxin domain-containing protein, partial [Gammaproteobacteria bacterium]|nr:redoxin domain-containing protein [Gammaproteobacteria bacterium]NIO62692.1 redoxin domain-containing protein [Gammaproteobacteria bacterium]NIT42431.1 redoxin domain-containing protein [Gammaproteobacteria bacterium]